MSFWELKILLFLSTFHFGFPAPFRIDPPVISSVLRTTTTESPFPIVNKHFFIHSFPEEEKPLNNFNKQRRTNYRIFFITLPKLLDSKTKFATQTSDGTLVYIVNRKVKDDERSVTLPTITTTSKTTTTTTTTTQKPRKYQTRVTKQKSTTLKPTPTPSSEPEIITAPDVEYDKVDDVDSQDRNTSSELSKDYKEVPEAENNDDYTDEDEDS